MAQFEPLASANVATNTSGENQLAAAPGAGFKIRVHSYRIIGGNGATANTVTFLDGSGGSVKETIDVLANTGSAPSVARPDALFELSANKALVISLSAAQRVTGGVTYSIVKSTGLPDEN